MQAASIKAMVTSRAADAVRSADPTERKCLALNEVGGCSGSKVDDNINCAQDQAR